jgi:hypothetical protein
MFQFLLLAAAVRNRKRRPGLFGAFITSRFITYHPGLIFPLNFAPMRAALTLQP